MNPRHSVRDILLREAESFLWS